MNEIKAFFSVTAALLFLWWILREANNYLSTLHNKKVLAVLLAIYEERKYQREEFERENDTATNGWINHDYQKMLRFEIGILMQITLQFPDEHDVYWYRIKTLVGRMNGSLVC